MDVHEHPFHSQTVKRMGKLNPYQNTSSVKTLFLSCRVRVSDYPYLCLAYKLPLGHTMSLALHIRGRDYSVPVSPDRNPPFPVLASFWDYSQDGQVQDDNCE